MHVTYSYDRANQSRFGPGTTFKIWYILNIHRKMYAAYV